jgi:hypothetical protein
MSDFPLGKKQTVLIRIVLNNSGLGSEAYVRLRDNQLL